MPRAALILPLVVASLTASVADARLFWQTYGSTTAAPDGAGCVWNYGQDYFVPRHCTTGRYDLFSSCKESHRISPACVRLHPTYDGYCTPYTGWHYLRRDHVYKKRCGCTPLKHYSGPWKLDRCKKCCFARRDPGCRPYCGDSACGDASACGAPCVDGCFATAMADCGTGCGYAEHVVIAGCEPRGVDSCYGWLPNVEPLGGETLGGIPALPMGSGAAAGGGGAMGALPGVGGTLPAPTATPGIMGLPTNLLGF